MCKIRSNSVQLVKPLQFLRQEVKSWIDPGRVISNPSGKVMEGTRGNLASPSGVHRHFDGYVSQ
jgi:hypothetical protein